MAADNDDERRWSRLALVKCWRGALVGSAAASVRFVSPPSAPPFGNAGFRKRAQVHALCPSAAAASSISMSLDALTLALFRLEQQVQTHRNSPVCLRREPTLASGLSQWRAWLRVGLTLWPTSTACAGAGAGSRRLSTRLEDGRREARARSQLKKIDSSRVSGPACTSTLLPPKRPTGCQAGGRLLASRQHLFPPHLCAARTSFR